ADVALLATLDGDVCEGDAANLFVVVDGVVVTPALDRGVLPGITRGRSLDLFARAGRPCKQASISPRDLARVDEAFLTSSLDGVRPLRAIDGRTLVAPGPVSIWLARCLMLREADVADLAFPGAAEPHNG